MAHCEELHQLLTQTVIPEIEHVIVQMDSYAANNEITPDMAEEQTSIKAIHDNFSNIVASIEAKEIEAGNCEELLKELNMMRQMGMEADI